MENHQNKKPNNSLSSFLNLIPDAVIIVDSRGFITATNQMVGKYTGITPKDLLGNRFIDLPFLDDRQKKLLAEKPKKEVAR